MTTTKNRGYLVPDLGLRGDPAGHFREMLDAIDVDVAATISNTSTNRDDITRLEAEIDVVAERVELLEATTAAITLYVATTGDDDTGDGTEALPYATVTTALEVLPEKIGSRVRIMVGNGAYTDALPESISREFVGAGTLVIENADAPTIVDAGPYTATVAALGNGEAAFTVTDAGAAWAPDALKGKFLEVLDGDVAGLRVAIIANTGTMLTIQSTQDHIETGATFRIVEPGITFTQDYGTSFEAKDSQWSPPAGETYDRGGARLGLAGISFVNTLNKSGCPWKFLAGTMVATACSFTKTETGSQAVAFGKKGNTILNYDDMHNAAAFEHVNYNDKDMLSFWCASDGGGDAIFQGSAIVSGCACRGEILVGNSDISGAIAGARLYSSAAARIVGYDCDGVTLHTCYLHDDISGSPGDGAISMRNCSAHIRSCYVGLGVDALAAYNSNIDLVIAQCDAVAVTGAGAYLRGGCRVVNAVAMFSLVGAGGEIYLPYQAIPGYVAWPAAGAMVDDLVGTQIIGLD